MRSLPEETNIHDPSPVWTWCCNGDRPLLSARSTDQPLDELYLACVVEIVRGDTGDEFEVGDRAARRGPLQVARWNSCDRRPELAMGAVEQRNILLPRGFAHVVPHEPVRAVERESAAGLTCQPPMDGVLPIRRVNDNLPDVVPAPGRTPRCLSCGQPPNRPSQVRPVPGSPGVRAIEDLEERVLPRHQVTVPFVFANDPQG